MGQALQPETSVSQTRGVGAAGGESVWNLEEPCSMGWVGRGGSTSSLLPSPHSACLVPFQEVTLFRVLTYPEMGPTLKCLANRILKDRKTMTEKTSRPGAGPLRCGPCHSIHSFWNPRLGLSFPVSSVLCLPTWRIPSSGDFQGSVIGRQGAAPGLSLPYSWLWADPSPPGQP